MLQDLCLLHDWKRVCIGGVGLMSKIAWLHVLQIPRRDRSRIRDYDNPKPAPSARQQSCNADKQ